MILSPRSIRWMMNLYPPNFFNRIVLKKVSPDFRHMEVHIKKSLLNKNLNGTIFGGTLCAATDPFYSIMYWQIFERRGIKMEAWVRAVEGSYIKPGTTDMRMLFDISEEEIENAQQMVQKEGRIKSWHTVNIINKHNEVCAEFRILVYMRAAKNEAKSIF